MKLIENVIAVEPYPVIYIDDLDLMVASDLHLGFEIVSAEHGVFIPRVQFNRTRKIIEESAKKSGAGRILLLGDVKHEFSETGYHEYKEVSIMLEYLKRRFREVILVKGNHDTFIVRMTRKYGIEVYDIYNEKGYTFFHGHKDVNISDVKSRVLIMGHEHPSISLFTDIGVREKLKVFLYGEWKGKSVVVLPAVSYFAEGSDVNVLPKEELISPLLRKMDIDKFKVVGILEDDRYLELPEVGKLRKYG
ncbi:MAG TPA: metallophosphoesterase [Thermoplasmatales archaeon]|nr:MAG: metallophosphoesterase [Thermoplasmata archaeon]KAA0018429.1 MAG: metallophosphoesterase [Thermoplasmata archaeon]HHF58824.1 metallophosphoesterase [Thermoplasmatales archaeon]